MRRRGPLQTCGISMIEILGKAYKKTKDFNGPIGSMTKRVVVLVTTLFPFIIVLQDQWLAVLSYADDGILAVENVVETLFPPSACLFNKIDKLVHVAECLPGKFDDAMNKFPVIMHQVPFLDWALAYVILWLNFLIITLTHWGSNNMMEKEIRVDINCENPSNQTVSIPEKPDCPVETTSINPYSESVDSSSNVPNFSQDGTKGVVPDSSQNETKEVVVESSSHTKCTRNDYPSPLSDSSEDEAEVNEKRSKNVNLYSKMPGMRRSYKEILEMGTKESAVKKDDSVQKKIPSTATGGEKKDEEGARKEDDSAVKKEDSVQKEIPSTATRDEKKDEEAVKKDGSVQKEIPSTATGGKKKYEEGARKEDDSTVKKDDSVQNEIPSTATGGEKKYEEGAKEDDSAVKKDDSVQKEIPSTAAGGEKKDEEGTRKEDDSVIKKDDFVQKEIPSTATRVEKKDKEGVRKEDDSVIKKADSVQKEIPNTATGGEKKDEEGARKEDEDIIARKDRILELFDESWHLNPGPCESK